MNAVACTAAKSRGSRSVLEKGDVAFSRVQRWQKPILRRNRPSASYFSPMSEVLSGSSLPIIQTAVTPVILLSGVGALMITLTNRMGRIVDRTRSLAGQAQQAAADARSHIDDQLHIMWRRANLLRLAVTLAGISMLLSCVLVMVIFVEAFFERHFGVEMVLIFGVSVACLILSLVWFLRDIWLSLAALHIEVERARRR